MLITVAVVLVGLLMRKRDVTSLSILLLVFSVSTLVVCSASVQNDLRNVADMPDEKKDVQIYVICLGDVTSRGISNLSRVVEGVIRASQIDKIHYWNGEWRQVGLTAFERVMEEVNVTVEVAVMTNWEVYRNVLETSHDVIFVNAHGENLPVPADYTKEEWVDEIANAMAYRNATWVHIAGYPFHNYYHQEFGEGAWGEEGFKRLMSHIGKSNVTCWPPAGYENEGAGLSSFAEQTLPVDCDWAEFYFVEGVDIGWPLKEEDFKNYTVMPLYRYANYSTGAIIAFKKLDRLTQHGFYVYIGTDQTYDAYGNPTDKDFYRGYVGAAAAIWAALVRSVSEQKIHEAEAAIVKAKAEGRVKGLDEANNLLRKAVSAHNFHGYTGPEGAIFWANKAKKAANQATQQSFLEAYIFPITISSIIGVIALGGLVIKWRNNRSKNSKTRCEKE